MRFEPPRRGPGIDVVRVLRKVEGELLDHLWVTDMFDQVLVSEDAAAVLRRRGARCIEDACSRGVDRACVLGLDPKQMLPAVTEVVLVELRRFPATAVADLLDAWLRPGQSRPGRRASTSSGSAGGAARRFLDA